jgi:hypothetical protein
MTYFENTIKNGAKKNYALGFCYDEEMKRLIESSTGSQIGAQSLDYFVALKFDKTGKRNIFRAIDFQLHRDQPGRKIRNDIPSHANPHFHLFEKHPLFQFNSGIIKI